MQLRIFTEPQQGASYDDLLAVAKATEDLGFDAFFRSDHYQVMGGGDGLPGPSDAWTTLAGLARETSRIRLGTLVTPATFRRPGPLAITVAGVDQMSGGRVEFGFGAGWFDLEHASYGIPFPAVAERYDRFEEQLAILDGLWRTPIGQTFSYPGRYYQVVDSPALPKPAQSPRVPIILGGAAKKRGAALAVKYADEFNVPFSSVDETAARFGTIGAAFAAAGETRSIVFSAAQTIVVGANDAEVAQRLGRIDPGLGATAVTGTPDQVVARLSEFAGAGASRLYLQILDLADLDHLELIAARVAPQLS
jgi:F420-dependent oxidoreductase-like protein